MAGIRKAKHDIAPAMRKAFLKGFEIYCRKHKLTYSQAMAQLIETEGLLPVLDRVSKFTVRENTLSGKVEHEHTHVGIPAVNEFLAGFIGRHEASNDEATSEDRPILSNTVHI